MTDPSEYLNATDETGAVAAADLMDRLTERLKAADGSAAKLKERRAAAEAIAGSQPMPTAQLLSSMRR